jgi:hypothetical protein
VRVWGLGRALGGLWVAAWPVPAAAQQGSIGPELGVGEYREAASSLRYSGVGPGAAGWFTLHRVTAEGAFVSIRMNPTNGSQATESFRAMLIDAWLRWDPLDYLGFEVGLTKRAAASEFAAQSVGAVRVGARTHYLLGPGAGVWLRGNYLTGARFSGGGRAPLAMEIGLGLEIRWSSHFRATAQYSFQRLDRKTNPAGGAEASVPIEQALARVGLAVGF